MGMREQKITLGDVRKSGVRGLVVYSSDYRWSRHIAVNSDWRSLLDG